MAKLMLFGLVVFDDHSDTNINKSQTETLSVKVTAVNENLSLMSIDEFAQTIRGVIMILML